SWGDGSANSTLNLGANVLTFGPANHTYLASLPGNVPFTVTVTVTDKDGGAVTRTTTITVRPSIYVLNATASGALSLSGNAILQIAGAVQVDSSSNTALPASGNAVLTANAVKVVG